MRLVALKDMEGNILWTNEEKIVWFTKAGETGSEMR